MKKICRLLVGVACMLFLATGCSKKEAAMPAPAVIKLTFKGYAMADTLEVMDKETVIATLRSDLGFAVTSLMGVNGEQQSITLRKKSTKEVVGTLPVSRTPFNQVKKIFYDGKTVDNKIDLTPVTNPRNMGLRLQFKTKYPHFYGGPVDIVFYEQEYDMVNFIVTVKVVKSCNNIGNTFSEFIELPELISTADIYRGYAFKVYKAGTTDLPYTADANLSQLSDPENNFGGFDNFTAGTSHLYMIDSYYDNVGVIDGYRVEDITAAFQ